MHTVHSSTSVSDDPLVESGREAVSTSRAARLLTTLAALALLIPVIGLFARNDQALERFHNRTLARWPDRAVFLSDPVGYFDAARMWLRDRAYPIVAATKLSNRFTYRVLGDAPAPRITIGKDGHVFVNGTKTRATYGIFESTCLNAHRAKTAKGLEASLAAWSRVGRRRRLKIDVISVPTANSLYADKLPSDTPDRYLRACGDVMAGRTPLLSIKTPPDVVFVYPLQEMLSGKEDDAFYPRGNWHPTGMSLRVARDSYLARRGLGPPATEIAIRTEAAGEILASYGIEQLDPVYVLQNAAVSELSAENAALVSAIAELFKGRRPSTHIFANAMPVSEERVLMLSDSFGDFGAETFAGAFKRLIHVTTNDLSAPASKLINQILVLEPVERIIILIQEGNANRVRAMLK